MLEGRICRESFLVALRQLMLLPVRVEGGERVLPAPDDADPDQRERAGDDQAGPGDSGYTLHVHPSNALRSLSDPCLLALTVSTTRRTVSLIGPRGGRSAALGYGA